jgi:hypothetical protein
MERKGKGKRNFSGLEIRELEISQSGAKYDPAQRTDENKVYLTLAPPPLRVCTCPGDFHCFSKASSKEIFTSAAKVFSFLLYAITTL